MQRMEGLPYKMISSSLVGPVGKDYRRPKPGTTGNLQLLIWLLKTSETILPWRCACTYYTTFLLLCHNRHDFSSLQPWESEISTLVYHNHSSCLAFPPCCSKWQVLSGTITNLFVSKSQLPFFKISHLSLLLPDMFTVVMTCDYSNIALDHREPAVT